MKKYHFALSHYTNFFASILLMATILLFSNINKARFFSYEIIVLSIIGIILGSVFGIMEKNIMRFSMLSCLIQTGYFLIDFGVMLATKKTLSFALIHFINFSVTGLLFASLLSRFNLELENNDIRKLHGFYTNNILMFALIVACFSLGGLPGFNIFVGEYLIYLALFKLNPMLMSAAIFASLLAFIFYFRLIFLSFAGKSKPQKRVSTFYAIIVLILSTLVILLGVYPFVLLSIAGG